MAISATRAVSEATREISAILEVAGETAEDELASAPARYLGKLERNLYL